MTAQHTISRFYMKPPVYVFFVEKGNEWSAGVGSEAPTLVWRSQPPPSSGCSSSSPRCLWGCTQHFKTHCVVRRGIVCLFTLLRDEEMHGGAIWLVWSHAAQHAMHQLGSMTSSEASHAKPAQKERIAVGFTSPPNTGLLQPGGTGADTI